MPKLMDSKRLVWIKCYGIPMHAWTKNFFKVLHSLFGEYMYTDKPTSNKEQLDVSHFVICTTSLDVINTIIMENTNGVYLLLDWWKKLIKIARTSFRKS